MKHAELVELAALWLRRNHAVVITEMSGGVETADAIGFAGSGGYTTLVECKVSRNDFLTDKKKHFRYRPEMGMGLERYYLAPEGVIDRDELPANWGLLMPTKRGVRVLVKAQQQERRASSEIALLVSALRRIGGSVSVGGGMSVRHYTYTTKNTATLGVEPLAVAGGAR